MRKLFKKLTAMTLSLTLVAGMTSVVGAGVATGTDVSAGKSWSSYSIYTREDHTNGESTAKKNVCWYHSLTNTSKIVTDQHYVDDPVTDAQLKTLNDAIKEANKTAKEPTPTVTKHANTWGEHDSYKCFGENAKITTQTASSFTMDVVSTGWSATWSPMGTVVSSNPWGVTATKVVNIERGRYYTISFKIKSTLSNQIMESKERADKTGYNEPTDKYNYLKHIHFKAYDDKDESGKALELTGLKATIGGKSALVAGNKTLNVDFNSFIALDSKNTADDGWVTVTANVLIPSDKADWQADAKNPTMGIKFAFGAFLKEFPDENDMAGTIEVKDFTVKAANVAKKPAKVNKLKVTAKKKSMIVKFKKAKNAKKYEVQYSTKKNFKKATIKTTKKTSVTIKKLRSKKTYYVRVRGIYTTSGSKICGAYSAKKKVKIK